MVIALDACDQSSINATLLVCDHLLSSRCFIIISGDQLFDPFKVILFSLLLFVIDIHCCEDLLH